MYGDADGSEQVKHCTSVLTACGVYPSMAVSSGRGCHFYFCTDVPLNQFSELQKQLIAKLGTDPAVKDLPRVMRLPGTLHLKDPDDPRLVKLLIPQEEPVQRWQLEDLISKLGLSLSAAPEGNVVPFKAREWAIEGRPSAVFAQLRTPIESLTEGLDTNNEEIRSAVMAIPPSVIADEGNWTRLAFGLAHEARVSKKKRRCGRSSMQPRSGRTTTTRKKTANAFRDTWTRLWIGKTQFVLARSSTWPHSMDGRAGRRRSLRPDQRHWCGAQLT